MLEVKYVKVGGVTLMEHDGLRAYISTVPWSREDVEDFLWPLVEANPEVRADYDAGCQAWLIERSGLHVRIIGPALGWQWP